MNIKIFLTNNTVCELGFKTKKELIEAVKRLIYNFKNSKTVDFYNDQKQVYVNTAHIIKIEVVGNDENDNQNR